MTWNGYLEEGGYLCVIELRERCIYSFCGAPRKRTLESNQNLTETMEAQPDGLRNATDIRVKYKFMFGRILMLRIHGSQK